MIRFVFFDLGNVLVHFDPAKAVRQTAEVLGCDQELVQRVLYDSGLELKLEGGEITVDECISALFEGTGSSAQESVVLNAMSDMFHVNNAMITVVQRLFASGYPLGLLSNTCGPHWDWLAKCNLGVLRIIGPRTVLSYEAKSLKPSPEIYRTATELAGVGPDEILLIDDLAENVEGAKTYGWQAIQYSSTPALVESLRELGVKCFY